VRNRRRGRGSEGEQDSRIEITSGSMEPEGPIGRRS